MSLKLFVDDIRECPEGWHPARTVTEAVRVLATMPVEVVSLDHDIETQDYSGRRFNSMETFATVAYYLAAMCVDEQPKKVFIHTANPAGAKAMEAILENFGDPTDPGVVEIIFSMKYKEILEKWPNKSPEIPL